MDTKFDFYDLVWAAEYCIQIMDAISNATDTSDFGLDSKEDFNRYQNKLYELYSTAVSADVITQLITEIESDGIDASSLIEIMEEDEYFKQEASHDEILNSLEIGDFVRLSSGNEVYVCDREGMNLWVTKDRVNRINPNARGWSADLHDVVEILEHYEE